MLDNTAVEMSYWEFKDLYSARQYPLYYVEEPRMFLVMMFERHRAYRCVVIKDGFQSSFETNLSDQDISDIYLDFTGVGGLRSQAKRTDNLVEAMAIGINENTYKYVSQREQEVDGNWKGISFAGKCKSFTINTSVDIYVRINDGDLIMVKAPDGPTLEFDYKLVDPVFYVSTRDPAKHGKIEYFIDGEVL